MVNKKTDRKNAISTEGVVQVPKVAAIKKAPPLTKEEIIDALESVKAIDIKSVNLANISPTFDLAIICGASSTAHCRGVVEKLLATVKTKPLGVEGRKEYQWVLVDYANIIVHIFLDELRPEYQLEELYQSWVKEQTALVESLSE